MMRPRYIWPAFALCLAVVGGTLAWASLTVIRLDRAQAQAARQAALEERVRLALWRMDSVLSPLIALEGARPYFSYSSFHPANSAYGRMFNRAQQNDGMVASPLLNQMPSHVLLHFQVGPDGVITSPQVPTGRFRELAQAEDLKPEQMAAASARLEQLKSLMERDSLPARLAQHAYDYPLTVLAQQPARPSPHALSMQELQARVASAEAVRLENRAQPQTQPGVVEEQIRPLWAGPSLLLARRVRVGSTEYLQGCWLDWDGIRKWLLESVRDLLPSADLKAIESPSPEQRARVMACLPVALVPGDLPQMERTPSPLWWSLGIAWACVILATGVTAMLLRAAVSLGERRGAFASAVTHELRTPLTTFRMYAEMLAEGIVRDEEKRRQYLTTMCEEADRLGHLVGNVLSYAHLDGSRAGAGTTVAALHELLESSRQRLAGRAARAGMTVVLEKFPEDGPRWVRARPSAVEQILMNLVDNACKYASGAEDRRLHLSVGRQGGLAAVCLRDHGPGIDAKRRRKLFRPFSKSSAEAANSAAGVGLGLALSKRLARDMGGDLRLDSSVQDGACFVLLLPICFGPVTGSADSP